MIILPTMRGVLAGGLTPLFAAGPSGSLRWDWGGQVGCKIVIGSKDVYVYQLGRWVNSGNYQVHTISLWSAAGALLASASVATSGVPVGYAYSPISAVKLTAGATCYISSLENAGYDQYHDNAAYTPNGAFASIASGYAASGYPIGGGAAGYSYVPCNLLFKF
ncbi:MAG: hypothetical protein WCK77_25125 [Verrucomicrobiota bacterium]